jgi:chemotaxis protein MotB
MSGNRKNRRKGKGSIYSEDGGWEVVYSGFVLILLCFFIMLSSFASIEQGKVIRFVKSFVNALNIFSGGLKAEFDERVVRDSKNIVDKEDPLAQVFQDVKKVASDLGLKEKIDVSISSRGLVMRISNTVLFDLGVAELSVEAFPLMAEIASIILRVPHPVRIEGHTDNLPIHTETFPSNWELSTARAVNVLRHLIDGEGIPAEQLSAVGFGEFQPLCPNDSPEHRARNRRVEIVFVKKNEPE